MNDLMMPLETANDLPAIPEKFRDPETGEVKVDALLKSYMALEKKMSCMMPRPENDEDKIAVFKMLGMPETPDEYEVDTSHGLFEADGEINARLYEKGFTLEQVQAVYDLAADKFVPMILELAQEFQADREVERLVAAFGGEEKWQQVSKQLLSYGKKNLPPEVLGSLAGSFEGVMALYRMMKGEDGAMDLSSFKGSAEKGAGNDLNAMMRDPRYWRDRDPSFVQQVTDGFKSKYQN